MSNKQYYGKRHDTKKYLTFRILLDDDNHHFRTLALHNTHNDLKTQLCLLFLLQIFV